jgi:hypothetical protein
VATKVDPVRGLSLKGLRRLRTLAAEEAIRMLMAGEDPSPAVTVLRATDARLARTDDNPPTLQRRQQLAAEHSTAKGGL